MKPQTLYRIASILILLFAVGHTLGFRQVDPHWGVDSLIASMQSTHFEVQGSVRTYWDFFLGFGFFITVFLVLAAVLAWQMAGIPAETLTTLRTTRWALALCFCAVVPLSWRYIFMAPLIFSIVIALILTVAAALPAKLTRHV